MSKLSILGIDIENTKREEYAIEQNLDAMLAGIQTKEEVHDAMVDLDESCRAHHNAEVIIEAHRQFPEDKGLEAIYSSEEAWNMSDTLKKTLEKFKVFFQKVFEYISNFVTLRINASASVVDKWYAILSDANNNKARLETIQKEYDVKDCSTDSIVTVLSNAVKAYNKITAQVEAVNKLSPSSTSETDIKAAITPVTDLAEYKTFDEEYSKWEKMVPEGDNSDASLAKDAVAGKWFEAGSVESVSKQMNSFVTTMKNIKRLQASCMAIVSSLEKTQTGEGNEKEINKQKIEWLRNLSKNILSGMIGKLVKVCSRAASKCQTLTNKYNEK